LLRSRAASFWRLRLIWDLMFATEQGLDQVCAVNTGKVSRARPSIARGCAKSQITNKPHPAPN
jgi:hypothetical protein